MSGIFIQFHRFNDYRLLEGEMYFLGEFSLLLLV